MDIKNNPILVLAIGCFLFLGVGYLTFNKLVKVVAEEVKKDIKRDYVPGPYNPGYDPDKLPKELKEKVNYDSTLNNFNSYWERMRDER